MSDKAAAPNVQLTMAEYNDKNLAKLGITHVRTIAAVENPMRIIAVTPIVAETKALCPLSLCTR